MPMKTPRYNDDPLAAAIGHITMLKEQVETLTGALREATQTIGHQDNRLTFLEENLKRLTQPRALLTIQEASEALGLCARTLKRWRDEPNPRIPFIKMEGGDVRYRREEIDRYLNSREQCAKQRALKAT